MSVGVTSQVVVLQLAAQVKMLTIEFFHASHQRSTVHGNGNGWCRLAICVFLAVEDDHHLN